MRRDLIIGLLVSLALHGGVLFYDKIIKFEPPAKKKEEAPPTVELIEMPKIEPEEPEVVEASDEPIKPMDFAPPMQNDLPQVVTPDSFVQKIQPPPPENVKPAAGLTAWNGPYLKGGNVPNDPWGKAYIYRSPAERSAYEIVSYGADGQEGGTGTSADISTASAE